MKYFVIGDEDTILGFSLVGVKGDIVDTPEEARTSLNNAFQSGDIGIVIITERVADMIRQDVEHYFYNTVYPLIVEIPDRLGPKEGRGTIRDIIRSAVGVNV